MDEKIVFAQGKYWTWKGDKDYLGRYILDNPFCNQGILLPAEKCREVFGIEYTRQMEGIQYFRALRETKPHNLDRESENLDYLNAKCPEDTCLTAADFDY